MPCPGTKLPFIEVYSESRQRYGHMDMGPPLQHIVPRPTAFNCVIQKVPIAGQPWPALTLMMLTEIEAGQELYAPARHATGVDGWPYNFAGRVDNKVPAEERNSYCRHLGTAPADAPQEAKDAAQKLLRAYIRGEDWVEHWATSCQPETPGAGYFILTPAAQFLREMPPYRHLLPAASDSL